MMRTAEQTAHTRRRILAEADALPPDAQAMTWRLVSRLADRLGEILGDLGRASPRADATRLLAEAPGSNSTGDHPCGAGR
jgi:hypothetical protein